MINEEQIQDVICWLGWSRSARWWIKVATALSATLLGRQTFMVSTFTKTCWRLQGAIKYSLIFFLSFNYSWFFPLNNWISKVSLIKPFNWWQYANTRRETLINKRNLINCLIKRTAWNKEFIATRRHWILIKLNEFNSDLLLDVGV